MSELRELYQSVILDHNKSPRNRGELVGANRRAEGHNPLCGDHVIVMARVAGWSAHVCEQLANNRLIRPRARYTGPAKRSVKPLNER